jgi:hypothetical protein
LIPLTKDKIVPFADTVFKQTNLLYDQNLASKAWWEQFDTLITFKRALIAISINIGILTWVIVINQSTSNVSAEVHEQIGELAKTTKNLLIRVIALEGSTKNI